MSSDETANTDKIDKKTSLSQTSTATSDHSRTMSQYLRYLDDALTHFIEQLTSCNSVAMSDLSLKNELMRNNESRVIGFFARQLVLLQKESSNGQNGGYNSEYSKLERFLSVINLKKTSIEYISQRLTFNDVLNNEISTYEQILYDAGTTESERNEFYDALRALKECIAYFSNGGTNDNGRFYWHKEIPSNYQIRSPDTDFSTTANNETIKSPVEPTPVSSEHKTTSNNTNSETATPLSPNARRNNPSHTPPPSRVNHLRVKEKRKGDHSSKKTSPDTSVFHNNGNPPRTADLQLPIDGSSSRRSSYGSDSEGHAASGSVTPKSPTLRSPTMSNSPFGSAHTSDVENESKSTEPQPVTNTSPVQAYRLAHRIQHKWSSSIKLSTCNVCSRKIFLLGVKCNGCKFDKTRVMKFSFCGVCNKKIFRGKACIHCKYKCHKECVPNAPPTCGFNESKLIRVIDNGEVQQAFASTSSPLPRKYPFLSWGATSPTSPTPLSAPDSPASNVSTSHYIYSSSTGITDSTNSTQYDPESWVVIETTSKTASEIPESHSDSDTNSTLQTDTGTNSTDLTYTTHSKLVRQLSQSEPPNAKREDLVKSKLFDINSFDDEEIDPEKRSMHVATSLQDWVIVFNNIKMIEEVKRSSGKLMKANWHGEIAVRMIKPDLKVDELTFLNQFRNQVFRLRKVRHEHLNLYTGVCIETPNLAIVSNWIRGMTLFEIIHLRSESIALPTAAQYAAQIAQAMSYLHEKSINHMSLRTTNIFLQNNRVILTDYGLVPLSKCYRITDQPAIIAPRGWLSYLAPEIIRKLNPYNEQTLLQHTPQTDVYAFGTVWYELLFREFPFAKQPPEYIIWRAGNSLKQPLSSVHISKHAKEIISQCWSFVPDDRPDFAMLCKSLSKIPGKRPLARSPSTPLQYNTRPHVEA